MADDDQPRSPSRVERAEERTHWAEDRTILAVERTFAGWMRTAFAAIGIGLGFRAVFGDFDPPWLARAIASVFIAFGAFFAVSAERRAASAFDRLNTHAVTAPRRPNIRWVAWSVAGGAVVLIAGLWLLTDGAPAR